MPFSRAHCWMRGHRPKRWYEPWRMDGGPEQTREVVTVCTICGSTLHVTRESSSAAPAPEEAEGGD